MHHIQHYNKEPKVVKWRYCARTRRIFPIDYYIPPDKAIACVCSLNYRRGLQWRAGLPRQCARSILAEAHVRIVCGATASRGAIAFSGN
jgi:hypothetical protein